MSCRVLWRWRQGKADSIPWHSSHTQNRHILCAFLAAGGSRRWMPCSCSVCFTVFTCLSCKDMLVSRGLGQSCPSREYINLRMSLKSSSSTNQMWWWHIKLFWESGIKPGLCHWQLWGAPRCDHSLQTSQILKIYESVTISLCAAVLCITDYYKNFRGRKMQPRLSLSCKPEDNLCFWINFYVLYF